MVSMMEIHISVRDHNGAHDDISFIDKIDWETPEHLRVATQMWLASRLAAVSNIESTARIKGTTLEQREVEHIQLLLASNPQSPPAVLVYLAKCGSNKVLERIAEHPQASPEVLRELVNCEDSDVRVAIAENPNAPKDVLEALMKDDMADVRYRLAENPLLPMDLLTRLCVDDTNPYVAARASTTMARLSCGRVFHGGFSAGVSRWRRGKTASG